jgi:hypothetical protein
MKFAIAACAILSVAGAASAHAQPGRSGGSIPAHFHGRWAETPRACRGQENVETIITVNARGWSSFEEGGRVTRVGQVRRGTHYFRVHNHSGAEETMGSIALRRQGARLIMTFDEDNGPPVTYDLVRCRR